MLDPAQRAAACAPSGASGISAGAGTGKTTTLTARIAWLVTEAGLPPAAVMAVTFTNKAAREIRERVAAEIGDAAASVRIGTFHSLSARILRRNAAAAGLRSASFTVADEDDSLHVMAEASQVPAAYGPWTVPEGYGEAARKAHRKEWEAGLRDFASRAARQVSMWKSWGLDADAASDPSRPARSPEEERFAAAYAAYQYGLEGRNMADFGDLVLKVVRLLRDHPHALEAESGAVRHLLVDEAQDANPVQVEWARLMSSWHGGITVVGDEDQNIYGFQGGYTGAMADMAGPSATWRRLSANRRCTEEILRPANMAVSYNRRPGREDHRLVSGRHGRPVRTTAHPTEASEAAWVAARVSELVGSGVEPGQIAILLRARHLSAPFEEALARRGVVPMVVSGTSLMEREEARDVVAIARMAVNPYDDIAFRRLAARPSRGLGPAAVETICGLATARDLPFHTACSLAAEATSGFRKDARAGAAALSAALDGLARAGRWGGHAWDVIDAGLRDTGYLEWLRSQEDAERRLAVVEAVHRLSDGFEDLADFIQQVALMSDADRGGGGVRISTIHSAKGLEFDHVFCPAFDEGCIPSPRAVEEGRQGRPGDPWDGPRGEGVEEERRLAHVAFTRARHGLDVSFAWKRGKASKRDRGPSSFLAECDLEWEEVGPALTADLGRKKARRRPGRAGFDR